MTQQTFTMPTGHIGSPTRSIVRRTGIIGLGIAGAALTFLFAWPVASTVMWVGMLSTYNYYRGSEFALRRHTRKLARSAARLQHATQGTVRFTSGTSVDVTPGQGMVARRSFTRRAAVMLRKSQVSMHADFLRASAGREVSGRADSSSVEVTFGRNL